MALIILGAVGCSQTLKSMTKKDQSRSFTFSVAMLADLNQKPVQWKCAKAILKTNLRSES